MQYFTPILGAIALTWLSFECLHLMQSLSYFLRRGYHKILNSDYFVCVTMLEISTISLQYIAWEFMVFVEIALTILVSLMFFLQKRKVKLALTQRIKRQIFAIFLLNIALCLLLPFFVLPIFTPLVSAVAFYLMLPIENGVKKHFIRLAKQKLKNSTATKIAIVGSFAKTSVKLILSQLLPDALASPNSSNTPMGICKFINETDISKAKYLIFEMGARQKGDILELCQLVNPHHTIFTGVTTQHLETFKTLENIVNTKQEILHSLPKEGIAVLNGQNKIALDSQHIGDCKKIVANTAKNFEVELLSADKNGSQFTLTKNEQVLTCHTSLLGVAHISNISLCLAFVDAMGENLETALQKLSTLPQIPHRMQLIEGENVTVVDDGYNANPVGIECCCLTLDKIVGKKIVVAQGIVEGGKLQYQLNQNAGEMLGKSCDVLVACGKNSLAISKGGSKYCKEVHLASDLNHAVEIAQKFYDQNTYVIFQNDIP